MSRDDLSVEQKRQVAWGRRAFVRDVGRIWMDLIEAGQDPTPWAESTKESGKKRVREARDEAA